jgi:hypothetical protein
MKSYEADSGTRIARSFSVWIRIFGSPVSDGKTDFFAANSRKLSRIDSKIRGYALCTTSAIPLMTVEPSFSVLSA